MQYEFLMMSDLDKKGVQHDSLYITGNLTDERCKDSPITPPIIAQLMVSELGYIDNSMKIFEPCAGFGGILEELSKINFIGDVFFNEIEVGKSNMLESKYHFFKKIPSNVFRYDSIMIKDKFDIIIMNPPFNTVVNFVSSMMDKLNPGGVLVTLFPTYFLTRLNTHSEFILKLLSHKEVTIKHIPSTDFDCGYNAKISLIKIVKA